MKCQICKNGSTKKGKTTLALTRGEAVVVIRDVPAQVCGNCGQPYFSSETSKAAFQMAEEAVRKGAELEVLRMRA